MQPRILYPARLSLKIEGEIKSFQDKTKRICKHQTSPTGNIERGPLSKERAQKENRPERNRGITVNSHFTGNTMALNSYL